MTNDFYKGAGFITFAAGIFLAVNMYLSTDWISPSTEQGNDETETEELAAEPAPDEELTASMEAELEQLRNELAEAEEANAMLQEADHEPGEERIIAFLTVESGMTTSDVTDFLVQTGLVEEESEFRDQWRESGREELLQQGRFELNSSMEYLEMIETFTSSPS
ncbi:hypothetical protein ACFO4L_16205 [Bacillus daqingensis]|uniref:YceG-like family protein n=1 Tax=Bacillus daqingensis TaxID=872396 RepID=A0ABV9NXN6_9BACI